MERYDEYRDSGVEWIGEIPAGWEVRPAKRCIIIRNGSDPKSLGDTPVYGSGGNSFKTCGEFKDGPAVLLGRKGTINVPQWVEGKYWNVDTAFDVVSIENTMILRYYFYQAQCFDYERYGTQTALPSMAQSDYRNMLIVCPDITSQAAIVRYLDSETTRVDSLIADCEREVELLQEYRKAVISEAVTKGLDPNVPMKDSGIEWIGEIPEVWIVRPAKSLFTESKVLRLSSDERCTVSQKYGVIPQSQFTALENQRTVLADKNLESWKHVSPGDFVISLRSFQGGIEFCRVSGCVTWHYIVLKGQPDADNGYFRHLFKSKGYIEALQRTCTYIRDGQDLRYSNFIQVSLPLPPLSEQHAIATYLDKKTTEIDAIIAGYQSMADKLREYRKSLISEAVTGKFKVPGV